jgi:hypothetical protein
MDDFDKLRHNTDGRDGEQAYHPTDSLFRIV